MPALKKAPLRRPPEMLTSLTLVSPFRMPPVHRKKPGAQSRVRPPAEELSVVQLDGPGAGTDQQAGPGWLGAASEIDACAGRDMKEPLTLEPLLASDRVPLSTLTRPPRLLNLTETTALPGSFVLMKAPKLSKFTREQQLNP